jgi:hypothetical protein
VFKKICVSHTEKFDDNIRKQYYDTVSFIEGNILKADSCVSAERIVFSKKTI